MRCRYLAYGAVLLGALWAQPVMGQVLQYTTTLSGAAEDPPNSSLGTGTALLTINLDESTMRLQTDFSGLTGNVTVAHIHCCVSPDAEPATAGVATTTPTFPGFPAGGTSGSYDMTFDLTQASSYGSGFLANNNDSPTEAMQTFLTGIDAGEAYLNIHTSFVGSGEIRGFFQPVPEPSSGLMLLLAGLATAAWRRRCR